MVRDTPFSDSRVLLGGVHPARDLQLLDETERENKVDVDIINTGNKRKVKSNMKCKK